MLQLKLNMIAHGTVLVFVFVTSIMYIFSKRTDVTVKVMSIIAFMVAFYLMLQRDTYLPFLGPAAMPLNTLVNEMVPSNANVTHELKFPPNMEGYKILYWGAQPSTTIYANPWDAYASFDNAGVAIVRQGKAVIKFFCPAKYKVPSGVTLDRHIHYRTCCQRGMLGPVETVYVRC
jgi:hypothetical protein